MLPKQLRGGSWREQVRESAVFWGINNPELKAFTNASACARRSDLCRRSRVNIRFSYLKTTPSRKPTKLPEKRSWPAKDCPVESGLFWEAKQKLTEFASIRQWKLIIQAPDRSATGPLGPKPESQKLESDHTALMWPNGYDLFDKLYCHSIAASSTCGP